MDLFRFRQLTQDLPDDTEIVIRMPDNLPGYYVREQIVGIIYVGGQLIIDIESDEERRRL